MAQSTPTLCTLPASVLAEASVYVGEPELAALLGASRALHLALHAHPDADAAVWCPHLGASVQVGEFVSIEKRGWLSEGS